MHRRERTWAEWTTELWADAYQAPPFARTVLPELDRELDRALLDNANALAYYTPRIAQAFLRVAPAVAEQLQGAAFQAWVNTGQALAPRHWELAVEYFRVAPRVLPHLDGEWDSWIEGCRALARTQPSLGLAAVRYSPAFLATAGPARLGTWFRLTHALAAARGPRAHIAQAFLLAAGPLLARLPEAVVVRWVDMVAAVADGDPQAARAMLERDLTWFSGLAVPTAAEIVALTDAFRRISPLMAQHWWEAAGRALSVVPPETGDALVGIAAVVAPSAPTLAQELFAHAGGVFAQLSARHHGTMLGLVRELTRVNPSVALAFFTTGAGVCQQLDAGDLRIWFDEGLALARSHPEAAAAFFRQESHASQVRLQALRQVVHLDEISYALRRYGEALCSVRVALRPTDELPFDLRALGRDAPTTDGRTIFLPRQVDRFGSYDANFTLYKLAMAHQAGYFECGTFRFNLGALADHAVYEALLATAQSRGPLRPALSDFERFFTLFGNPDLARDLFAACEDARVDHQLWERYPGLRTPLQRLVARILASRRPLHTLPLRQAAVEWLVRLSLTRLDLPDAPDPLGPLDRPMRHMLGHVLHSVATVMDSAVAAIQLYALLIRLPNVHGASRDAVMALAESAPADFGEAPGADEWAMLFPDAAEGELPYAAPDDVPYRGKLDGEQVQKRAVIQVLQDALRDRADEGVPLSAELLRQLLEMGVNINIKKLDIQQLLESSDLFIHDLEGRPGLPDVRDELADLSLEEREQIRELVDGLAADILDDPLEAERVFYYDEWDADIEDYRHRWCRVKEVPLEPGESATVAREILEYADLIRSIRQQFQMVKPEQLRRVRRLHDGEDLELNDAIAAVIDRKLRRTPDERIYQERQRQARDVATLFLVDVSASTDEWVEEEHSGDAPPRAAAPAPPAGPGDLAARLRALWDPAVAAPAGDRIHVARERRIIDIERAAVVVMAEALQGLGDAYAIYGFSGYGRENVDLFPVKTFADAYSDTVRARLAALEPHKSTRMGPAIRHATALLQAQPAKLRTLILISDGYPQDMDYGKDRTSKAYGVADTMVALREARQAGIMAFCLTVDQAGHDYLRQMCGNRDYLVIEDVRALPSELPKVYRGLTT